MASAIVFIVKKKKNCEHQLHDFERFSSRRTWQLKLPGVMGIYHGMCGHWATCGDPPCRPRLWVQSAGWWLWPPGGAGEQCVLSDAPAVSHFLSVWLCLCLCEKGGARPSGLKGGRTVGSY